MLSDLKQICFMLRFQNVFSHLNLKMFTTHLHSFFLEITCLIQCKNRRLARMSQTTDMPTNIPAEGKRKIAPRSALGTRKKGVSRQPGRPHKRLSSEVLVARTTVLHKKLQVLLAKRTLIAERLEAYEAENKLRKEEEDMKSAVKKEDEIDQ